MGGDRRRTPHSIDVPTATLTPHHNSRKRGSNYAHEDSDNFLKQFTNDEEMNECNAALILMHLSNSPKSPKNGEKWLGSSPGSSSASWSSGSSSPPLSDDGQITHTNSILHDASASARIRTTSVSTSDEGIVMDYNEDAPRKRRVSSMILATAEQNLREKQIQIDIGSLMEKAHKHTFKCTWKGCDFIEHTSQQIELHIRTAHLGNKKPRRSADYDGSYSESDHEEEFYYTEVEDDDDDGKVSSPPSQPTLSHRDMARPPHEDPEYQRQIVGNFKQGRAAQSQLANGHNITHGKTPNHGNSHISASQQQQQQLASHQLQGSNTICIPTSPLAHHNYTWPSTAAVAVPAATSTPMSMSTSTPTQQQQQQQQQHSPVSILKHARYSPRPSAATAPYHPYVHHNHSNNNHHKYSTSSSSSVSSNSSGSNNTSPIIHSNSSANNVLQQLSQQNVTVTAHHSGSSNSNSNSNNTNSNSHHQQLSAVTITPNYTHHAHHQQTQQQQRMRGHHSQTHQQQQQQQLPQQPSSTTTASNNNNIVASGAPHHAHNHAHHQHQHQHSTHQPHTTTHSTHHQQQHHQQHQQHQHIVVQHAVAAAKHTPNSPHRRTRGENKKCRKVYGMDRRDQWCTQCKWKKACSRFGD